MDEKNKISPQYKINMSFNLCQKSDRGSLTDLSAKGAGIDQKIISDTNAGFSYLDQQHDGQFNNFVQDTSVRTCMEGKRNVFSAVIPERGDLLTSAMIVLTTIQNPESMVLDKDYYPYDLIDNIEVRLNGQCIQRITRDLLDIPYTGINDTASYLQHVGYDRLMASEGPIYIPINAFFAKKGNYYPLMNSVYPLEIRVRFVSNEGQVTSGDDKTERTSWTEDFEVMLLTTQIYLNEEERAKLAESSRQMYVLQRHEQKVTLASEKTKTVKLESNLPLRLLKVECENSDSKIRQNTKVRLLVNGNVRFEHYAKLLRARGALRGFGMQLTDIHDFEDNEEEGSAKDNEKRRLSDLFYHFGDVANSPLGRLNLSQIDNPTLEFIDMDETKSGSINIVTETYNILSWEKGQAYLFLHKSR